jgi:cell wall-associated NlpC family hydrolase
MTHWATQYIGLSWEYGGQGPEAYDCWNFVRKIQRDHFGVEVPIIVIEDQRQASHEMQANSELDNWQSVDVPQEGDIVMMARAKIPAHIGVCVRANNQIGVLHCIQKSGVVFTAMSMLSSNGWGSLKYYRHKT